MTVMKAVVLGVEVINVGDWDEERSGPIPPGAVTGDYDVVETARGRLVLANDYAAMRKDEYPQIGDQLDAMWEGGGVAATMRAKIAAIKAKYPKP